MLFLNTTYTVSHGRKLSSSRGHTALCCTKMYLCPEPECASGHNQFMASPSGEMENP